MADYKQMLIDALKSPMGGTPQGYLNQFLDFGKKFSHGISDVIQPEFQAHANWYEKELPTELDKHTKELGMIRTEGSPRDAAAEFSGAADYAMRTKDYNRAMENADVYQTLSNPLLYQNRRDAIAQDKAGIEWAKANPNANRRQAIEAAIEYATKY